MAATGRLQLRAAAIEKEDMERKTVFLDPTKIAKWELVRRLPLDANRPIQGRLRRRDSNAYKNAQAVQAARLKRALNSLSHGRNIFAYNNIRTNQVVYSLTRYLEVDKNNNRPRQMAWY